MAEYQPGVDQTTTYTSLAMVAENLHTLPGRINDIHNGETPENNQNDLSSMSATELLQYQLKAQQELFQQTLLLRDQPAQTSPTWSFTQGLIIGQASVIVIIIIFIKFFVFADPSPTSTSKDGTSVVMQRGSKSGGNKSGKSGASANVGRGGARGEHQAGEGEESADTADDRSKISSILEKTYYDVDNHASESLDWFNVLIAQTISQLRTDALNSDNIYHSLDEFLGKTELPDYLGKIKITEIDIGDDFPIFSNCRIKHSKDGSGRLESKIDVDLSDTLTLGIETQLLLNQPRPLTAVLPVELSVSIVRFSGCLTVSLINTNDLESNSKGDEKSATSGDSSDGDNSGGGGTALMFSFSPDYRLEFSVKSLIGSRAKLQNVPKISSLIDNRLREWFIERCIEPRFQVVKLPSLWPRRKNTREPLHSNANGIVDKTDEPLV